VLAVKISEELAETAGDAILLVKLDATLENLVANGVSMGEVFSENGSARLIFLAGVIVGLAAMLVGIMLELI